MAKPEPTTSLRWRSLATTVLLLLVFALFIGVMEI